MPTLTNAHIHLPPNFSAFESVEQALTLAQEQGVGVLGASNYYDYTVYKAFAEGARQRSIFPVFGLEIISLIEPLVLSGIKINDPGNPGKMYLCGKGIMGYAQMSSAAQRLLQTIRDHDAARMAAITDKLAAHFAAAGLKTGLNAESIKDGVVARHRCPRETVYLQERHVAQAFQEVIFNRLGPTERPQFLQAVFGTPSKAPDDAVTVQNEIRSYLLKAGKPAFVPDTFVDFDHAYALVLALGGIPCYPTLADGASPICEYEQDIDTLIADLKARGIFAAEFIPIRNRPEVLTRYVHAMREAGLFVTAGTEHNTRDLLPLAPTCAGGESIPEDIQEIFWEGACVVAAHQSRTATGETGFVDAQGQLNPAYADAESRIAAFRQQGEAVIAHYQELCAAP